MKKVISSLVVILSLVLVISGCGKKSNPKVSMEIENMGTIVIELDPSEAPLTCENFQNLVNSGFYDGLTFHRVMPGFVLQGGDPEGNGTGGSELQIKGEFSENGVENNISHQRGVISMARSSGNNNSASSQFFFCLDDVSDTLDGKYAAFGHVTEGMEIVDKIVSEAQIYDVQSGLVLPENQVKIVSAKVIEE